MRQPGTTPKTCKANLQTMARTVQAVWRCACKHDGIDPKSRFVAFSSENPYAGFVDTAYQQFQQMRAAYQAGGYI